VNYSRYLQVALVTKEYTKSSSWKLKEEHRYESSTTGPFSFHNVYNMTARMEDYFNPTAEGVLSWLIGWLIG